jgi:hypothetical protein
MKRQSKMFPNKTDLDSPRVRFNWGFHDATMTIEKGWKIRRIVKVGECSPEQINETEQKYYAAGYRHGLLEMQFTTTRPESSTFQWLTFLSYQSDEERKAIEREVYECEVGGLEHCMNHRADDYILNRAKEYADRAMTA